MSIYRENSEVSAINRMAGGQAVKVEPQLFGLLQLAAQIHDETAGAFDITTLPLSSIWGFDRRDGRLPAPDEIAVALKSVGCDKLKLDPSKSSVEFSVPGLSINLGGIGKGYALDRVVELLESCEIRDFIVHGGQSSVVARGSQNVDDLSVGWSVGLSHPLMPDRRLAEIKLRNEALGTSGTGRQGFFVDGRRYGHIIDPRTGWPTDHFLSTTVISHSAALSDALATAFFVMPLAEVETWCRDHEQVKVICVVGGRAGQIELEWFNLAEEDWKRV
jgi:thiamine biosynthesis lipoprotein